MREWSYWAHCIQDSSLGTLHMSCRGHYINDIRSLACSSMEGGLPIIPEALSSIHTTAIQIQQTEAKCPSWWLNNKMLKYKSHNVVSLSHTHTPKHPTTTTTKKKHLKAKIVNSLSVWMLGKFHILFYFSVVVDTLKVMRTCGFYNIKEMVA